MNHQSHASRRAMLATSLRQLAPALPAFETAIVIDRALDSRGLSTARPDEAAWLALVAYARHAETDYDALLAEGYDVDSARYFVREAINAVLGAWGVRRRVSGKEPEGAAVDPGPPRP